MRFALEVALAIILTALVLGGISVRRDCTPDGTSCTWSVLTERH